MLIFLKAALILSLLFGSLDSGNRKLHPHDDPIPPPCGINGCTGGGGGGGGGGGW